MGTLKRPGPNPHQPPSDSNRGDSDPQSPASKGPWIVKNVDAATLITLIVIALLVPLLITGFLSQ